MAYIDITGTTTSSISVRLAGLDTSYNQTTRSCKWYLDGTLKSTKTVPNQASTAAAYTFSGLDSNTSYEITAIITNIQGSGDVELSTTESTDKPSVSAWSWFQSNGTATAAQTEAALNALNGSIPGVSNFKYTVWNDLVDKVSEMRTARGVGWNTVSGKYLTYGNTKMSSSDRTLTADRFNSLKYQVGSLESTGIADVEPGDPVIGGYFTIITGKLNNIINDL